MSGTNKDIAVAFYKKVFEGRVEDAFRLYAGPTYRQHNPLIEDGMEGLKKFVTWIMSNHPDARCEIKRVFADGDHVILHSHWHGLSDNPRGEAVVDIFRLEGGKVLEHWDVIQPIPETPANASLEHGAEGSVIVVNEILRCRVPWERFSDLAHQTSAPRACHPS
jgi:predicted SnoaL-like aldol condensation-catalyzing enzyme